MTIRIPAGEVTPHGWWHIINGTRPMMWLEAFDESVTIDLMGGLAPPYHDPMSPEAVALVELDGLIPPWRHIDQKGATQDGVTQVDALLDPIEVNAVVECIGRDPVHLRRVVRQTLGSIDAIEQSSLHFLDPVENGHWWAPIRWYKGAPAMKFAKPQTNRQRIPLRLRADNSCWQTYPDIAQFRFTYDSMVELFDFEDADGLGANWPLHFYEEGVDAAGFPRANGSAAVWSESGTAERGVVIGPYKDFDTDTDNQVIEIELGQIPEVFFPDGAYDDIWGRVSRNPDGTWKGDGVRARIGRQGFFGWVELARFNNFVKTTMYSTSIFFWPAYAEKFSLVCGAEGDPRMFRILRNGIPVLSHKEIGEGTELGEAFRGVAIGMKAMSGASQQGSPPAISRVSAGDNAAVTQSGWLECTNVGDQKLYYDYTLFGPAEMVRIYDGPATDEFVEFGPLTANQIVYLRTDPRSKATLVKDLTVAPSTPQEQNIFQQAINSFLSFAFANNVPPLLGAITNIFGNRPPQGQLYKFLNGRFSDRAAIPPKSPGNPAQPYHVKVEIVGGNAHSKVIAAGTPLRRYPL